MGLLHDSHFYRNPVGRGWLSHHSWAGGAGLMCKTSSSSLLQLWNTCIQTPVLPQGFLNPLNQHASPENRLAPCSVLCHQLETRKAQGCCLPLQFGRLSWRLTASFKPLQGCWPAGTLRACWGHSTTQDLLQESWQEGGKQGVQHSNSVWWCITSNTIHCTVHSNWPKTH